MQEIFFNFKKRKVKGGFYGHKSIPSKSLRSCKLELSQGSPTSLTSITHFVNWIIESMSTVSSSVLINGGN